MMKFTLSLIGFIILFISFSLKSQQYDSLVMENAQWKVAYHNDPYPAEMFGWLLRGDTLINDYQYKKVFKRHFQDYNSNVIDTQYLFGVVREDVENKLVYAIQFYESAESCDSINSEFRLYDFSCQLEDTLLICFTSDIQYVTINEVDTIFYYGKLRRTFYPSYSVLFIEGVGHLAGLFENPVINVTKEPNYFSSELIDYCVGSDEECSVYYVKVDESAIKSDFVIYPNPCKGDFQILSKFQDIDKLKYSMADIYGKAIKYKINYLLNHEIELYLFNPGIYILTIYQQDQLPFIYKIININF